MKNFNEKQKSVRNRAVMAFGVVTVAGVLCGCASKKAATVTAEMSDSVARHEERMAVSANLFGNDELTLIFDEPFIVIESADSADSAISMNTASTRRHVVRARRLEVAHRTTVAAGVDSARTSSADDKKTTDTRRESRSETERRSGCPWWLLIVLSCAAVAAYGVFRRYRKR
jgi:cobalamin biosynthesis Mg chelatase CobN